MIRLKDSLRKSIIAIVVKNYPDKELTVDLSYCEPQFGHFSTNFAMVNAKSLQSKPMDVAENLAKLIEYIPEVESVNAILPGFVNIRLKKEVLVKYLNNISSDFNNIIPKSPKPKKIVMDYSHPNVGKPMGAHHLLSTVIGDSIKKTYKKLGHEVIADNFIGDMGTQFGRLIHAVKEWGNLEQIEKNPVVELHKLYVKFHIQADDDDSLDDAGRKEYQKLEQGDKENRELLSKIQSWSKADMQSIYDFLKIDFDYMNGESFYESKIKSIISLGLEKKVFQESQGALVYKPKDKNEPAALVQKKDGTSLYLTRDLARIQYWEETWHPDYMIVVVDLAQSLQLKQLFEISTILNLTDAKNIHVAFGRMSFKDKSMSTRKGNIVLISDLISHTQTKIRQMLQSRDTGFTINKQDNLINKLTSNCLKYNILRQNRLSNIVFDWDSMTSLEGNNAPYLAYTMSRMHSIDNAITTNTNLIKNEVKKISEIESELCLELFRVSEVLEQAAKDFQPTVIATYCYNLSQLYNSFYQKHKIISSDSVNVFREKLNKTSYNVLKLCFEVLGLELIEKM